MQFQPPAPFLSDSGAMVAQAVWGGEVGDSSSSYPTNFSVLFRFGRSCARTGEAVWVLLIMKLKVPLLDIPN